jgi:hypothetical protein
VGDASQESASKCGKTGRSRTLPWDIGRAVALRASPAGEAGRDRQHRNEVLIGDIASGE